MIEEQDLLNIDEEDVRNWRFCYRCGKKLISIAYSDHKDKTKPQIAHYDRIDGRPRYWVYKACPEKDLKNSHDLRHTYGAFLTENTTGTELVDLY